MVKLEGAACGGIENNIGSWKYRRVVHNRRNCIYRYEYDFFYYFFYDFCYEI